MKQNYIITELNGNRWLSIPILDKIDFIRHSFIIKQKNSAVEANGALKETAARILNLEKWQVETINQTHSDAVFVHNEECRASESDEGFDAHITNNSGIAIGVVTADCVPVLLIDRKKRIVAAVHSGWRGTAKRILQKTVKKMSDSFGSKPEDMIAGIGPSIGQCCYEVDEKVIEPMKREFDYLNRFSIQKKENKWHIDLQMINREQLIETGLKPTNINIVSLCTFCYPDLFYSYRRDGAGTGRMMAVVMIK
ncbi:MAG: peptidoglycan editing factor PgeF [Nitrospirae bacterium]|nr:peptidoglycan editing factor PgeF [Nitrospirota bacterium]